MIGFLDKNIWQTHPFGNIGASIGIIMNRVYWTEKGVMYGGKCASLWHWTGFIYGYNPRSTGDGKLAYYKCWIKFLHQINNKIMIPDKCMDLLPD